MHDNNQHANFEPQFFASKTLTDTDARVSRIARHTLYS